METTTFLGIIAAICTTSAFLPQVIRTIKTKQTKDISLFMYLLFSAGVFLWLIYGLLLKDIPITVANLITLCSSTIILYLKIKNG